MLVRVANEKRFEARRGRWGLVVKGKMRGEREAWASYIVDHVGGHVRSKKDPGRVRRVPGIRSRGSRSSCKSVYERRDGLGIRMFCHRSAYGRLP